MKIYVLNQVFWICLFLFNRSFLDTNFCNRLNRRSLFLLSCIWCTLRKIVNYFFYWMNMTDFFSTRWTYCSDWNCLSRTTLFGSHKTLFSITKTFFYKTKTFFAIMKTFFYIAKPFFCGTKTFFFFRNIENFFLHEEIFFRYDEHFFLHDKNSFLSSPPGRNSFQIR